MSMTKKLAAEQLKWAKETEDLSISMLYIIKNAELSEDADIYSLIQRLKKVISSLHKVQDRYSSFSITLFFLFYFSSIRAIKKCINNSIKNHRKSIRILAGLKETRSKELSDLKVIETTFGVIITKINHAD